MRSMIGGGGGSREGGRGGEGYGSGSGNFSNPSPSGNFAPNATPDGGLRGGYGPGGQGPNPGMKNNFASPGGSSSGYPQSGPPPLPAGTPPGEQSAQNQGMMTRGRGMGSIFYKTKLCSRFRNSSCPYNTNCNFAHGPEELRRPPPGWEEVVGPQEGGGSYGGGGRGGSEERSGSVGMGGADANGAPTHQALGPNQVANPSGGGGGNSNGNGNINGTDSGNGTGGGSSDRFHKTRPCKKYMSGQVCPYGDRCNFLHDEPNAHSPPPSKSARDIVVVPVPEGNGGGGGGSGGSGAGTPTPRPPNWKTRLCNKWETTGNCPFGEKCHFAHGIAELHRYGGGPIDPSGLEAAQMESKYGINQLGSNFGDDDEGSPVYNDGYPQGGSMRQPSGFGGHQIPRLSSGLGSRFSDVWKGPTEGISTIYGDWLEDDT